MTSDQCRRVLSQVIMMLIRHQRLAQTQKENEEFKLKNKKRSC